MGHWSPPDNAENVLEKHIAEMRKYAGELEESQWLSHRPVTERVRSCADSLERALAIIRNRRKEWGLESSHTKITKVNCQTGEPL